MPLVVIGVLLFLMKILDFDPVARWSWVWILSPFVLVFIWWEVIAPMVGWDKKMAEKKMREEAKSAEEAKKKNRGF
jgi:small Trp-rich protein